VGAGLRGQDLWIIMYIDQLLQQGERESKNESESEREGVRERE